MRVLAYIMVHYGKDYLPYAIRSIYPAVDKILILYSQRPSHNYTDLPCPETRVDIKNICKEFDKTQFVDVNEDTEGKHLAHAFRYAINYDIMVRIDADEVWEPTMIEDAVRKAWDTKSKYIEVGGFIHFWRSFNWVNTDGFRPVRLHNLRHSKKTGEYVDSKIYHFGYAIPEHLMKYKWSCHGHKSEIKSGWMQRWLNWRPGSDMGNMHPVTDAYWQQLQPFDRNTLPEMLKIHPFYNLDIIK